MLTMITIALILLLLVANTKGSYAPLLNGDSPNAIPGSYIIVLRDGLETKDRDAHILELRTNISSTSVAEIGFIFDVILGFSAKLTDDLLLAQLNHQNVKYVEANQIFSISLEQNKIEEPGPITQTGATWGITRISQRDLKLNGEYVYNSASGEGVDAYVFDTGILTSHSDFEGRASFFYSSVSGEPDTDTNGHGTHCAGTIGGATYGVAKKVNLKSVKVLNEKGRGTTDSIIAGVNIVTKERDSSRPAIASLSLEGPATVSLDSAVQNSIASGIVYVVAAGNANANACNYSPGRVTEAITVGATSSSDSRASYSNYGKCLDIFAPGTSIVSDYIGSDKATSTMSGTSMAVPHVTGAIAIHLSLYPKLTPKESHGWVIERATYGKLPNPGIASPNVLLYSPADQ